MCYVSDYRKMIPKNIIFVNVRDEQIEKLINMDTL